MDKKNHKNKSPFRILLFPILSLFSFIITIVYISYDQEIIPSAYTSVSTVQNSTKQISIRIVETATTASTSTPISKFVPTIIPTDTPQIPQYKDLHIGDTILLGRYEQDGNLNNGLEAIEWIVIAISNNNKALVISKYGIEGLKYNEEQIYGMTWEKSSLRSWLNNEFVNIAFSPNEQAVIAETFVENPRTLIIPSNAPSYWVDAQNSTRDKIFLLSNEEYTNFFPPNNQQKGQCYVTPFVHSQRDVDVSISGTAWWWLRSPGMRGGAHASFVNSLGNLQTEGYLIALEPAAVRPAFWLIEQ